MSNYGREIVYFVIRKNLIFGCTYHVFITNIQRDNICDFFITLNNQAYLHHLKVVVIKYIASIQKIVLMSIYVNRYTITSNYASLTIQTLINSYALFIFNYEKTISLREDSKHLETLTKWYSDRVIGYV